jgi:hypothetical protein
VPNCLDCCRSADDERGRRGVTTRNAVRRFSDHVVTDADRE